MRIFVAGATGVVGRPLVARLVPAGHEVTATTRTQSKVDSLQRAGATPVVVDALDRDAMLRAVSAARPEIVIHELTDLPPRYAELRKGTGATDRLRREGTRNLVDAAVAAGARRVIAQSIAFAYAPEGPRVVDEQARLWTDAPTQFAGTIDAVVALKEAVTGTPGIEGVVLRYGALYGPGTWYAPDGDITEQVRRRRLPLVGSGQGTISWLHVDDAASATVAALDAPPGIYNVTDDEPVTYLDWLPAFAKRLGAKPPHHVPAWLARLVAGPVGVTVMTAQRGASNAKARTELGWTPAYPSWRDGMADAA